MKIFELNCDMGEGAGNDEIIMPLIDACSIACGGHAGNEQSMSATAQLALKHGVEIGAHPSFPDKNNFGRKSLNISTKALQTSLLTQVQSLKNICAEVGAAMEHIKLHGALYNEVAADSELSKVVLDALKEFSDIPFLAPYDSAFAKECKVRSIKLRLEAFADRRYDNSGKLVSRTHAKAVITNPEAAVQQVLSIAKSNQTTSLEGSPIKITANTFCVHGDNLSVVEILQALKKHQFED